MTEADVLKLFSARRTMGQRSTRMLCGTCYALADWITRNHGYLTWDDMIELSAIGATMLLRRAGRGVVRPDGMTPARRPLRPRTFRP